MEQPERPERTRETGEERFPVRAVRRALEHTGTPASPVSVTDQRNWSTGSEARGDIPLTTWHGRRFFLHLTSRQRSLGPSLALLKDGTAVGTKPGQVLMTAGRRISYTRSREQRSVLCHLLR